MRPGGRLLGDRLGVRVLAIDALVEAAQEVDRLEVLATAVLVGDPLAVLARVVEVEHRRDGVDAQPVGVEHLQPEQGVGAQEVLHLVAPVVEDVALPVGLVPLARVVVLVEVRAVEVRRGRARRWGSATGPSRG